eukprot:TRINITY_DN1837_c0_g1_i10.p1 TRINITY_DN1837_c0_g1~~TRINITY_DN1837_c0_g1_i10.p1  ORF type:complete len:750 (-),score=261.77 TRINITY_DN1837_c0_g1_i10:2910-5159(-)
MIKERTMFQITSNSTDETIMYADDSMYTGGIIKKVPRYLKHGYGSYYYNNGDQYHGYWKNDQYDGEGTFWYSNGDKYHGNFSNGVKNGEGELELATEEIYKMKYEEGIRVDNFYGEFLKQILSGKSSVFKNDCIASGEMVQVDTIGTYKWIRVSPPSYLVLDGGPPSWEKWRTAMFNSWAWLCSNESTLKNLSEKEMHQSSNLAKMIPKKWIGENNHPSFWVVFDDKNFDPTTKGKFIFLSPLLNTTVQLPASKRAHILFPEELPETRDPVKKHQYTPNEFEHTYLHHLKLEQTNLPQFAMKKEFKIISKDSKTNKLTSKPEVFSKDVFKLNKISESKVNPTIDQYQNEIKKISQQVTASNQLVKTLEGGLLTNRSKENSTQTKIQLEELRQQHTQFEIKLSEAREKLSQEINKTQYSPRGTSPQSSPKDLSMTSSRKSSVVFEKVSIPLNNNTEEDKLPQKISITYKNITKEFDLETARFLLHLINKRKHNRSFLFAQNDSPFSPVTESIHSRGRKGDWEHKPQGGSCYKVFSNDEMVHGNYFSKLKKTRQERPKSDDIKIEEYSRTDMTEESDTETFTDDKYSKPKIGHSRQKSGNYGKPPSRNPPLIETKNNPIKLPPINLDTKKWSLHDTSSRTSTGDEDVSTYEDDLSSRGSSLKKNKLEPTPLTTTKGGSSRGVSSIGFSPRDSNRIKSGSPLESPKNNKHSSQELVKISTSNSSSPGRKEHNNGSSSPRKSIESINLSRNKT